MEMIKRYFTITKYNASLSSNTGLWYISFPSEFFTSQNPIKYVEVLNFLYFNESGQLDIGTSAHASFNTDAVENAQMIGFCAPCATVTKSFTQRRNLVGFNLWFKDYKGELVDQLTNPNHWFVLELNLIY